jgi:hypothetical protein
MGFRVWVWGLGVEGIEWRVEGLESSVRGLRFEVSGLGFRVQVHLGKCAEHGCPER